MSGSRSSKRNQTYATGKEQMQNEHNRYIFQADVKNEIK